MHLSHSISLKLFCTVLLFWGFIFPFAKSQDHTKSPQIPIDFLIEPPEPKPLNLEVVRTAIMHHMSQSSACIEGKLVVRVKFDEQGNYVKHKVLISPDPAFTTAVEEELPCLQIEPWLENGNPSAVWVTFPFEMTPKNR